MDLHKWQESKKDLGIHVQGLVSKIHKTITQLHHSLRNACVSECCLPSQEKKKNNPKPKKHNSVAGHQNKQQHLDQFMMTLWPMPQWQPQSTSVTAKQVAHMSIKASLVQNTPKRQISRQLHPHLLHKQEFTWDTGNLDANFFSAWFRVNLLTS